jgi:hypothetical protein
LTSTTASVKAWSDQFKGKAAKVLLQTIVNYLAKVRTPYTRHAPIVNSLGTGKLQMVDELATQIITVLMCLREAGTQGYTSRAFVNVLIT